MLNLPRKGDQAATPKKEELENAEGRLQNEAVLATVTDIGQKITDFLNAQ